MSKFFDDWSVRFTKLLIADFKFSPLDCHAVMGNFGEESAGFQALQEARPLVVGSKGGYGIAQWTGPRRRNYEAYCARNQLNPADMMSNYNFLFVELNGDEKASVAKVKAADTLEDKTEAFMKGFLRPGIPHLDQRIAWAKRAQTAWNIQSSEGPAPSKPVEAPPAAVPEKPTTPVSPVPSIPQQPKAQTLLDLLIAILRALFGSRNK